MTPAELIHEADQFQVSTDWISIAPQIATHLTIPIFFQPLFAYSSYNFYGAVICIKAVYSQVEIFLSSRILIVFDCSSKKVGKL